MGKLKLFFKNLLKKKSITAENKSLDGIKTSKKLFDFRGVFSFRPLDNGSIVRKEEFVLRVLTLLVGVLLIIVVLLVLTIKILIPLHKVEPVFLSVTSENKQIYWVEPLNKKTRAFRLVTESLIYQYIESRESIDFQTDIERYNYVKWLSSPKVYSEFGEIFSSANQDFNAPWIRAKNFNLSRGVKIIGIDFLNDKQLQADFNLFEYKRNSGEIVTKALVRATISIEYSPKKITAQNKYMNPLGLEVLDYSLSTRDIKEFVILKKNEKK